MTRRLRITLGLAAVALAAPQGAPAQPFPDRTDLGELVAGEGLALEGVNTADRAGEPVTGIGDLNHDGFDDVAVAAIRSDNGGDFSGSIYVVMGSPAKLLTEVDLGALDGGNGFRIDGMAPEDWLGHGLAGLGDVNGDGIDDLLVGAPRADASGKNAGEIYLVFGRQSFPPVLDLDALDGTNGALIVGIKAADKAGDQVAGAGDFNGDSIDDIVISATGADPNGSNSGAVYIGFGRKTWPGTLELASLNDETGFVLNGAEIGDLAGHSLGKAGDGFDDILIGTPSADPNGVSSGQSYLVFGGDSWSASNELAELDGDNGVTLNGVDGTDVSGYSVGGAGDVNRDGFDDIVIGARRASPNGPETGQSYIVYGKTEWTAVVELGGLDATDGVNVNGVNVADRSGSSVSGAGDFNGDGFDDVLIGAPDADPNGSFSGATYVIFGKQTLPGTIELTDLDGTNGTLYQGIEFEDRSGESVSSAGDFNGDGLDDLLIGSPSRNDQKGATHVVFGRFETGITLGATAPSCPGTVQLRAKGLTALGSIQLFRGTGRGESVIQGGACSGFALDLADAQLIRTFDDVNDLGQWLRTVEISNPNICGTHIQAVDVATCAVSNVTSVPDGG